MGSIKKERIKSMITIEQVEKLKKYTGVSYAQAKEALEQTDGDILEAVILLEKQQKIQPQGEKTVIETKFEEKKNDSEKSEKKSKDSELNETFRDLGRFLKDLLHKGNTNRFDVIKDKKVVMMIPMTLFVLLNLICFLVYVAIIGHWAVLWLRLPV
jgi:hypothetical protein